MSVQSLSSEVYATLLLTVRVNWNLRQCEVLKVERVSYCRTVEGIVAHEADDDARWNLDGEQFLLIHINHRTRNRQGLAHHAIYRILCSEIFQRFGMCQEHGWKQLDFSHKHYCTQYANFWRIGGRRHGTECIRIFCQFNLYVFLRSAGNEYEKADRCVFYLSCRRDYWWSWTLSSSGVI